MKLFQTLKNKSNGYSSPQRLVFDITADNSEEPKDVEMMQIANLSFRPEYTEQIMEALYRRMNDKTHWRHVQKALTLLYYLVHYGSLEVVMWYKKHSLLVISLKSYYQHDDTGKDVSEFIRVLANEIVKLVDNKAELERVRVKSAIVRGKKTREREQLIKDGRDNGGKTYVDAALTSSITLGGSGGI